MSRVLFVCLHNAGRSQMSEALFTRAAGERHEARSAGTTPGERVHPEVVEAMAELGIDLSGRAPHELERADAEWADVVVTMGCGDECPYIPGKRYLDWDLPDPKGRPLAEVRATREEIERRVTELLAELEPADPAAGAATALIEMRGVSRSYEIGGGTVTALDSVDLRVEAGEFVVILGPSGSGKTTLINMIGALDSPTAGSIAIAGTDITTASRRELFAFRRRSVGLIFQSFNLFPGLNALENVQFGADVAGRPDARERARQTLERVSLAERLDHFPNELSGGEQQRVAIARALAAGNPIVLADEPTGELDFRTGVQILELMHDVTHTAGKAVLVVTHNREIARVADRIVELSSGRIESDRANEPAAMAELRW